MIHEITWNLSELYKSNDDFYDELDNLNDEVNKIIEFKDNIIDSYTLLELLDKKWKIKERVNNLLIYGSLNYYKDIENEENKKMKDIAEKLLTSVDAKLSFIEEKIIDLGEETINEYLFSNEKLKIYRQHLSNIFRLRSHIQNDETNKKIEKLKNSINNTLAEYNLLNRDIDLGTIIVDGEEIKLIPSNISKYLSSRDREIRKQTYLSVNSSYKEKNGDFAKLLNGIYVNRVQISELEGYLSVGEKSLFDENINSIILEKLISTVNNNFDIMKKYLKLKSRAISIDDPHLYDYSVPFDNGNKRKYSIDEAIDIIKKALTPLGEEYLKIVDTLLSNGHIDAILDEKKHQSITFSWSTYTFMNYRGSYVDIKNLIHEIGHIVNAYLSKENQPFIYEDSTVFVGETSSLINEILLNRYLYQSAESEEEKIYYLSVNIENYFTQIFRQTMYTEFENQLYQYVKNRIELSSVLLESEYIKLLRKYYGKDTIYDVYTDVEWARLGHLYRHSYYVYKYATGLIMASAIVNSIINEKTLSIDKYIKFLTLGSSDYSLKLLQDLGIDLTDDSIMNNSFHLLNSDINEFEKILIKK